MAEPLAGTRGPPLKCLSSTVSFVVVESRANVVLDQVSYHNNIKTDFKFSFSFSNPEMYFWIFTS